MFAKNFGSSDCFRCSFLVLQLYLTSSVTIILQCGCRIQRKLVMYEVWKLLPMEHPNRKGKQWKRFRQKIWSRL